MWKISYISHMVFKAKVLITKENFTFDFTIFNFDIFFSISNLKFFNGVLQSICRIYNTYF